MFYYVDKGWYNHNNKFMSETSTESVSSNALVPDTKDSTNVETESKPDVILTYPQVHDAAKFLIGHAKERIFGLPGYKVAAALSARQGVPWQTKFTHGGKNYEVSYFGASAYPNYPEGESIGITAYPIHTVDKDGEQDVDKTKIDISVKASPEELEANNRKGIMSELSWITFESPNVHKIKDDGIVKVINPIRDTELTLQEIAQFISTIK